MYQEFFNLQEPPFSITPDPRFLFLGRHHREALAHLLYSVRGSSGFILLTGEVGAGKTTVSRCLVRQTADHVDVALIFNPRLSALELVASICDELGITYPKTASIKTLYDALNRHLLNSYANHRTTVLLLDEAQNLSVDLLEQIRLLSNLETDRQKLLQIILIGQPELLEILARPELRQFSQRVTARYHIAPLNLTETQDFIRHRLAVAGCQQPIFSLAACWVIHNASQGIPRQINQICDRALLGAYTLNSRRVTAWIAYTAVREVRGRSPRPARRLLGTTVIVLAMLGLMTTVLWRDGGQEVLRTGQAVFQAVHTAIADKQQAIWAALSPSSAVPATTTPQPPPPGNAESHKPTGVEPPPVAPPPAAVAATNSVPETTPATIPPPVAAPTVATTPAGKGTEAAPVVVSPSVAASAAVAPGGGVTEAAPPTVTPPVTASAAVAPGGGVTEAAPPTVTPPVAAPASRGTEAIPAAVIPPVAAPALVIVPAGGTAEAAPAVVKLPAVPVDAPTATDKPKAVAAGQSVALDTLFKAPDGGTLDQNALLPPLFGLWGVDLHKPNLHITCEQAASVGMACFDLAGNWNTIRQLGVPAIIELSYFDKKPRYALVKALGRKSITLQFAHREETIPLSEAERYWFGPMTIAWRLTPGRKEFLNVGMQGEDVLWLRSRLTRLQKGDPGSDGSRLFDAGLQHRLQLFQAQSFLEPDGIAGLRTLLALDLAVQDPQRPTPRLRLLQDGDN
ncbi:MAG: AAA family ATPase [Magnetococcales bacterium]|nr:AAA family ATPase [Magnetococcales bacterium]